MDWTFIAIVSFTSFIGAFIGVFIENLIDKKRQSKEQKNQNTQTHEPEKPINTCNHKWEDRSTIDLPFFQECVKCGQIR